MRLLAFIGALAVIVGIGAAVFFFGGYYSVAGTAGDPAIVRWALIQVRTASIARHAVDEPPTPFDVPMVVAGAKAFAARGCVVCHGGPGVGWEKFAEGMTPDPPNLPDVVNNRTAAQLFWVLKNGINMTGMPSFAEAGVPDDEIWNIVAFLKKLPTVSEADYKSWTAAAPAQSAMPPASSPTPAPAMPETTPTPAPAPVEPQTTPPTPAPDAAPKPN